MKHSPHLHKHVAYDVKMSKLRNIGQQKMTSVCCVIVLLMSDFLLSHSSAAIDFPISLLSEASEIELSPDDTWSCCNESGFCSESSSPASPWCAFDGNSSTRWRLKPGQRTLTVNLSAEALVDSFEVNFAPQSVIPSSAVVNLLGSDFTWMTYVNKSCQPNDTYLRRRGSLYYSCIPIPSSRAWNLSLPDGVFSIRNGSDRWLWWRTFHQFQLTIGATDADNSNSSANSSVEFADIQIYGWVQPSGVCNCHPVGVNNISAPCDSNGACICQKPQNNGDQCVPRLNEVLPLYGPSSGGTRVYITGIYLSNASKVTIGNADNSIVNIKDNLTQVETTSGGEGSSLPIQIFWEKPAGVRSSVIVDGDFTYKPDPVVYNIIPRATIIRGGIPQTVIGKNLDSVAFPFINIITVTSDNRLLYIYNYTNKKFAEIKDAFCERVNSTMLKCRTPNLEGIDFNEGDNRACIRVSLDIKQYNNYTKCNATADEAYGFLLRVNPQPDVWKDDLYQYPLYSERKPIEITGQYFQFRGNTSVEDTQITVGGIGCQIVDLLNNIILFYPPNASLFDTNKKHQTVFSVGYYTFTVGDLQYVTEDIARRNAIIGGVIGGVGGLIVLILLIVGIIRLRRRCHEKPGYPPGSHIPISEYHRSILDCLSQEERAKVEKCMVPYDRINPEQELGRGNFGKVFRGTFTNSTGEREPVAIKSLLGGNLISDKDKVEFLLEAMLMADFCHKHVLSLIAVVIKHDSPYVVLPLMDLGDLKSFVSNKNNPYVMGDLVSFSLQVAEGMEYLAEMKFVHRDLAARNCMINNDFLVKVADFGLARDIFEKDYYRSQDNHRPLPFKWMALECLPSNSEFTEKSDVWSYGVLVWELMTDGKRPYNDVDPLDLTRFLEEGRRLEKPPIAPDFMYDLMLRCWHWNREERPQFIDIVRELKEILSHISPSVGSHEMSVVAHAKNSYLSLSANPVE